MVSLGCSDLRGVLNRFRCFTIKNGSNREGVFMNRSFALKNRSNGEIVKNGSSRKLICLNQSNMFSLGSSNLRSVLNWLWSFAIINGSNWERVFMNRSFTLKNGKYVSLDLSNMFSLGSSDLRSVFRGNG